MSGSYAITYTELTAEYDARYEPVDVDLGALAGVTTNGLLAHTGTGTAAARTLQGTSHQVSVAHGDGVAGDPTFSLPQDIHTGASPTFAGMTLSSPLSLTAGGTAASLAASNGGIVYSAASALAVLAGTATARQMLQSGASGAPSWSTATWPDTVAANRLLYGSASNVVSALATAANAVLVTDGSGVPSLATALPNGVTAVTQSAGDSSNKVCTTGYADAAVAAGLSGVGTDLPDAAPPASDPRTTDRPNSLTNMVYANACNPMAQVIAARSFT